jgi:hypothetical protein
MIKEKLKIEFGQPENGWLPVDLTHRDFQLQFMASDVPFNPIDHLVSCIRQITKGLSTEVWWHLEPEGYYFNFDRDGDEYKLKIYFAKTETADKKFIYETQGRYEEIVMPFYRSIKGFFTRKIEEPHWPKTDEAEIDALTKTVKGG